MMKSIAVMGIFAVIAGFLPGCSSLLGPDPADDPETNFDLLWKEYADCYALFEEKGVDWNQVGRDFRPLVASGTSREELFMIFRGMLALLNDKHVSLQSDFDYYNSGGWAEMTDAFSLRLVETSYLGEARKAGEGIFTYGFVGESIGYLHIQGFSSGLSGMSTRQPWTEDIDSIIEAFSGCSSIIVDVRNNRGGLPGNVEAIAARFADRERPYIMIRTKNGPGPGDFSGVREYRVKPEGQSRFTGPVVLLTNAVTISGGEWFTLAMKSLPNITQAGTTTAGAMSLSLGRELPNGFFYRVSVQKITDIGGFCPEGRGISPEPDLLVENTDDEILSGKDSQLEAAIAFLTE